MPDVRRSFVMAGKNLRLFIGRSENKGISFIPETPSEPLFLPIDPFHGCRICCPDHVNQISQSLKPGFFLLWTRRSFCVVCFICGLRKRNPSARKDISLTMNTVGMMAVKFIIFPYAFCSIQVQRHGPHHHYHFPISCPEHLCLVDEKWIA